jgi:hypothetical protein
MIAYLLLLAVAGEVSDDDAAIAKGFDRHRAANHVAAPVHYEDTILIVSTKQGVAALQFTKPIDSDGRTGLEYRYRFLEGGKEEITGKGEVFTRARGMLPEERLAKGLDPESDEPQLPNKTLIRAGKIELVWSGGAPGKCYVYYAPENTRVQITSGKKTAIPSVFQLPDAKPAPEPLFRHDLKRFRW